jgi:hypothetical protein
VITGQNSTRTGQPGDHRSFRDQLAFSIGFAVTRSRVLLRRILKEHGPDDARRPAIIETVGKPAHEPDRPIGRPEQQPPASDVTAPPSKAATTWRPSTTSYPNRSRLHCVGIGELLCFALTICRRRTIADSEPRCTYPL